MLRTSQFDREILREVRLTDEQVTRLKELIEVMNEKRSIIGATQPGDAERTRTWKEYGEVQSELLAILPQRQTHNEWFPKPHYY
jgi:hypothetical protein